jgi:putative transposase
VPLAGAILEIVIERGYRLRFYPTPRQERQLARAFGCARWAWNFALEEISQAWTERQERLSWIDISRRINELKRSDKPWLGDVASTVVTQSLRNLDRAYRNFFQKRARYPRFKKRRMAQTVRYQLDPRQEGTFVAGARLVLPKLGPLCLVWSRVPEGRPLMVSVHRDACRRYFVSFMVEEEIVPLPRSDSEVGIDLGLRHAVTLSDGRKFQAPRPLRKRLRKVQHLGRVVSRRKKGSHRRERARSHLARAHVRVRESRNDWHHKVTTSLVRENQTLVVEDLNVSGMVRNRSLARSLSDTAFSEFLRQLEYKAQWYGRTVIKVDRFFPSSKRCSACGFVLERLGLSEREWTCPDCGVRHDRDVNAARNLLEEGRRMTQVPPGGRELMRVEGGTPRRRLPDRPGKRESHEPKLS